MAINTFAVFVAQAAAQWHRLRDAERNARDFKLTPKPGGGWILKIRKGAV